MFKNNDIFDTKHGGKAIIINYINSRNIQVQFLDDYGHTKWVNLKKIILKEFFSSCICNTLYKVKKKML